MHIIINSNFLYDYTMGGVDIVDQRIAKHTTNTGEHKYTKKVLKFMLDVSRVNAQTIYCLNRNIDPRKKDISFQFAFELGLQLIQPHIKLRLQGPGLQRSLIQEIKRFVKKEEDGEVEQDVQQGQGQGQEEGHGQGQGLGQSGRAL